MSGTFSFGFSGDDISGEEDSSATSIPVSSPPVGSPSAAHNNSSPAVAPSVYNIEDLLSTLPSRLSYNTLNITTHADRNISIPRRELFDIRLQLMAEDRGDRQALLDGLRTGDITPNVYEGGFKTWECSVDLVKTVLDRDVFGDGAIVGDKEIHVVELGCGTAIPTLALFQLAVTEPKHRYKFTLADYNYDVLRLVTVPNLLLSWALRKTVKTDWKSDDDLEITPEMLQHFMADLQRCGIRLEAISGAWGKQFVELLSRDVRPARRVVLASETIYSPASLGTFTETLLELIRGDGKAGVVALVAAKRVYFGVGGGVDEFRRTLTRLGGEAHEIPSITENGCEGVSRVVLEISCSAVMSQ